MSDVFHDMETKLPTQIMEGGTSSEWGLQ
jgi:hypothetical protein